MSKKDQRVAEAPCNRFFDVKACEMHEAERASVLDLALEVLSEMYRPGKQLASPYHTSTFLRLKLRRRRSEVFGVIFLDNRHRVIGVEELFRGTIDGTSVHSRVVVRKALEANAAAAIVFHNHPSGEPEPSQADRALTRRLQDALALIDVHMLDHVVVGAENSVSFAERGYL